MALRLSETDAIKNENGKTLVEWLGKCKFFSPKKILVRTNEHDRFDINIFTTDHVYRLTATPTYLGCIASTRKPRPGEDWTRGNDLPDGKFTRDTFVSILGAILFYEAKQVVKPVERIADSEKAENYELPRGIFGH